jgi:UPF0755 protein
LTSPERSRSDEEREAARLAREEARAKRAGKPRKEARNEPSAEPQRPSLESHRERVDRLLAARRGRNREPNGRRRLVALGAVALLGIAIAWFLISLFEPGKGDGGENDLVAVTIPRGAGAGEIGDLLDEREIVGSAFFFELRARLAGKHGDLKPGIYNLRRDMSYGAAIDALSSGPSPNLVNVTLPEGFARREIAGRIRSAGVEGDYVRASTRSRALNPRRYGAESARDLEGFLFPATYQLRRGQSARELVAKQVGAFKREWAKVDLRAARRANLTQYDVLIIASLVEREAQLDKERPLVASVIYNRLREGMNLGIDATVRYALNNWTKPLKRSELASPSPYNTYNNPGLPPGPIGNPGLASMRAAAKPARTGYLFYVVKPGTCGEHAFAETGDEHDRNVARYNEARAAQGGRSPTDC